MPMDDRSRQSAGPRSLGTRGFIEALKRTRGEAQRDHLSIVAAGVAFYAFLAIFPALAAVVSIYGLLADPQTVQEQLEAMGSVMPGSARDILGEQMRRVAGGSNRTLGWSFLFSLLLALWSANQGMRSMIEALNITYEQDEKRGFMKLNALSLLLTLGGVLTAVLAVTGVVVVPAVLALVGLEGMARTLVNVLRWPMLLVIVLFGVAVVYRLAPSREGPRWQWVTPGSLLATALWLVASIAFSIYVSHFANYDKTYGSLGAVVILLLWLYVGAYVVLLGAELNVIAERSAPTVRQAHQV